jgi:hypothetical protein
MEISEMTTKRGQEKAVKSETSVSVGKWTFNLDPKDTIEMATEIDRYEETALYMATRNRENDDFTWRFVRVKSIKGPSIPVEIWLSELEYRILQLHASKHSKTPSECAREMVAEPLDQIYSDGPSQY